ncbi:DUF500-domain-containing protein [Coniophora puteana RWD-64-598 SS2]|uniref:DUF500-domain-containing protein n=1 Tax=Coniophora puteana (strain RWD-64-598) TaxID=741705 RepID=A0A5M3N4L7_CONPW|nr:DUF500-domain-containing protein [Coniophora puteana RWD-64-598 SS2]EIW86370.1 DUF500-domain-containing protein [Coniophora puteana RWD-64-598 SS2]
MKFSTPFPQTLPKECDKAAKMFMSFVDGKNNGLDGVIPRSVLENAKGFAVFTILKAGFVFSARAGTGIVIAKLGDGSWSAPSAIGVAGLGVGGQLGAELTEFLVVLNSASVQKQFMSAGNLTLGGNLSVAVGPLGRNGEASGSVNMKGNVAATYSYSKTKGLFGGVSVEGSVIMERQDANAIAYGSDVTAKNLLSGMVEAPQWAMALVNTIESCTGMPGRRSWIDDRVDQPTGYHFGAVSSPSGERPGLLKKKKGVDFPPPSWGKRKDVGSYFDTDTDTLNTGSQSSLPQPTQSAFKTRFDSDFAPVSPTSSARHRPNLSVPQAQVSEDPYNPASPFNSLPSFSAAHASLSPKTLAHSRAFSVPHMYQQNSSTTSSLNPFDVESLDGSSQSRPSQIRSISQGVSRLTTKPELSEPLLPGEGVGRAIALHDFKAVESGDLSFNKGDVIIITRKSASTNDWWDGKVNGRKGIFPANFVEVV